MQLDEELVVKRRAKKGNPGVVAIVQSSPAVIPTVNTEWRGGGKNFTRYTVPCSTQRP